MTNNPRYLYDLRMPTPLRILRKNAGFKSAGALAERIGVSKELVSKIEAGERSIENHAHKIADALNIRPDDIEEYALAISGMRDSASNTGWRPQADAMGWKQATVIRRQIPVVAYVGAGSEVYSIDDHSKGAGLEMVDAPGRVNPDKAIALEVRGDSMEPVISDGFLLFYDKRVLDGVLDEWLGKICVVKIIDGPTLVKKVRRGSTEGLYHLCSLNPKEPDRLDQQVEWCAKVEVMVQR